MKNRKSFLIAVVLVLVLLLAVTLAACDPNENTPGLGDVEYKITFIGAGQEGADVEVIVKAGNKIAEADIPEVPDLAHNQNDGKWYVADAHFNPTETEVNAQLDIKGNITAVPKYTHIQYGITFVGAGEQGADVVIQVNGGEAIATAQIPAVPAKEHYSNDGNWYIAGAEDAPTDVEIDAEYIVTGAVRAVPKYAHIQHAITFVGAGEESADTVVQVNEGEKIAAAQIPAVPAKEHCTNDGKWYVADADDQPTNVEVNADYEVAGAIKAVPKYEAIVRHVTFKNAGTEGADLVKNINDGDAITASFLPELPILAAEHKISKDNKWYLAGEEDAPTTTEVGVGYVVNGDITVVGDYKDATKYTYTFKEGENSYDDTLLTIEWYEYEKEEFATKYQAVADQLDAQLASVTESQRDKTKAAVGWTSTYGGYTVNILDPVERDLTFVADVQKVKYEITFKQEGQEDQVKYVDIAKTGDTKLGALLSEVTKAEEGPQGKTFIGWITDEEIPQVANANAIITDDVDIIACYASVEDYYGTWILPELNGGLNIAASGKANIFIDDYKANDRDGAIDPEAGTYSFTDGETRYPVTFKLYALGEKMLVVISGYDANDEANFAYSYCVNKVEGSDIAGDYAYTSGSYNKMTVLEGGYISNSSYFKWIGYDAAGDSYRYIETNSSGVITKNQIVNIVDPEIGFRLDGHIYFKGGNVTNYSNSDTDKGYIYLRVADIAGQKYYAYENGGYAMAEFATIDGTIADGNVIIINTGAYQIKVKISGSNLVFPGEEQGTYTGDAGNIVLDGLGGATVNGDEKTYSYYNPINHAVIIENDVYVLANGAYTKQTETDQFKGNKYIRENSSNYWYLFDGIGGVLCKASSYEYFGTYTLDAQAKTGTITIPDSSSNGGNITIVEDGFNVFTIKPFSTTYTYVKEGYTKPDLNAEFEGKWKSAEGDINLKIDLKNNRVTYRDKVAEIVQGYIADSFTFTVKWWGEQYTSSDIKITVTKTENGVKLEYEGNPHLDEYGEYIEYDHTVEELIVDDTPDEGGGVTLDGTWVNGGITIIIDLQANKVTFDGASDYDGQYDLMDSDGRKYAFDAMAEVNAWLDLVDGKLVVSGGSDVDGTYTKQGGEEEQLDAFAGTWKQQGGSNVLYFDGKGNGTFNGTAFTYTVEGNTAKIAPFGAFNGDSNQAVLDGTIALSIDDEYNENPHSATYVKEA